MSVPSPGAVGRIVSLLVAALAAGVLVWMLNSPVFGVRNVTVHRADSSPPPVVDPHEVEAVVGSVLGQGVFRLDTERLRERLRAIPGVADALVTTSLDGRVTATVSYQAPVANWVIGGQSYLVNADGEILAARYQADLELTVEEVSERGVAIGDLVNVDALQAAYQLQNNLPLLRVVPNRMYYSGGGLVVVDHSGRELLFGDTDRLAAKLVALQAVLEEAGRRGERIASVDLRPVDRPTYRTVDAPPLVSTIEQPP